MPGRCHRRSALRREGTDRLHFRAGAACEGYKHQRAEQKEKSAASAGYDGASLHFTIAVWANWAPKLLFGPS
jgi:hypothetical protein